MSLDHCDHLFREVRLAKSVADICHALGPIFERYEVISIGIERGSIFWRARFCGPDPWPSANDMGVPPAHAARVGRLNEPNLPLLYASIKEETALREIGAAPGNTVQIIGYRTILGQFIRLAVVGELMHVHKLGYMRFTGQDPGGTFTRLLNEMDYEKAREAIYIDAFLQSLLADGGAHENDYIFTRAAAAMIHRDAEIDGIVFPSTKDPFGYNITLRGTAVSTKIHATTCMQCQVSSDREFGFLDYEVLTEALRMADDGTFTWVKPISPRRRRFFNLTKEEYDVATNNKDNPNAFLEVKRAHREA